ncbi:MAG: DUF167 domain-containing protein [Phycisphaerae bacterium]
MIDLRTVDNGVVLPVKIVPGASRTTCLGLWGDRVRIAVAAPPEQGKANKAVIAFLADRLGIRARDITIERGAGSAQKTIRIERVTADAVRTALQLTQS